MLLDGLQAQIDNILLLTHGTTFCRGGGAAFENQELPAQIDPVLPGDMTSADYAEPKNKEELNGLQDGWL